MRTGAPPRVDGSVRHAWLIRLIAGERRWGRLDVWPTRYGYTHYRLVVHPPGTSASERALVRLWQAWPPLGALTGCLLAVTWGTLGLPPLPVIVVAAAGVTAGLLRLARLTRRQRRLARSRFGGSDAGVGVRHGFGDMPVIERCWDRMLAADDALAAGAITAPQHEIVWAQVWDELAPNPAARSVLGRP